MTERLIMINNRIIDNSIKGMKCRSDDTVTVVLCEVDHRMKLRVTCQAAEPLT